MVDFICEYQNEFIYHHLFLDNLVRMMDKGIKLRTLFSSKVFLYEFDYDEWPTISTDTNRILKPYNGSIFKLRYEYPNIFEDLKRRDDMLEYKARKAKQDKLKKRGRK